MTNQTHFINVPLPLLQPSSHSFNCCLAQFHSLEHFATTDYLSSSSSDFMSALPIGEYEVFLSFRGPDVRTTFADHLYSCLARSRIRTFRDEEELRKGETIAPSLIQAIRESKIHIPILSQSYASSRWCLQELVQMVKCLKREKGHVILPIFYFIDPRDVRHQEGPFKEAFELHSQKFDPETIREWKDVLQEVGQMKGWHVTELDGQGAIVDQVLHQVELHLRSNYTLVTDELVGIDSHVEEVMKLLDVDFISRKIVGIHGMSGIGKTTIAKAVYNKVCSRFDRCCFLENVGDILSKYNGAVELQNKMISSILRQEHKVGNTSEGVSVIKDRVCRLKTLIILDDADERFEFDQILGKLCDFSSKSRFIITTRNTRVLKFLQEYKLYEPREMSYDNALKLFSKFAFGGVNHPPEDQVDMSKQFVKLAAGLPLALKVFGSLLFREHKRFWEEKLAEMKAIPPTSEQVQKRLKISYDELTRNEKKIFLDIACFFLGEKKRLPFYMWSSCNIYPESGISTLVHRLLLKVDEKKGFWMHDRIRDLGRAIVREEDIDRRGNRSRIWSQEDAVDIIHSREGTDRVEMLRVEMAEDATFTRKELKKLSRLRYLAVRNGGLSGDLGEILPNVRWLQLHYDGPIPTNFNTKEVVILDLENCHVEDNWTGWKAASKLKVLNLKPYQGTLNWISLLTNLAEVKLVDCNNCVTLPPLGNLPSLERLELVGFPSVRKVGPEFLGIATSSSSSSSSSSTTFAFPKLTHLTMDRFREWNEWEEWDSNHDHRVMPCIAALSFDYCKRLAKLPDQLVQKKTVWSLQICGGALNFAYGNPDDGWSGEEWEKVKHIPSTDMGTCDMYESTMHYDSWEGQAYNGTGFWQ
ncbi:unnamed protein product [Linum tenue]|uniref:TIR domain-containing protein n=1 Tax=Linum tenue TaxID=586396 RepID=A0AAV0S0L7_9ROSI|nr:unnamed protein product [Linum tenue]